MSQAKEGFFARRFGIGREKQVCKFKLKSVDEIEFSLASLDTIYAELVEIISEYNESYKDVLVEDIKIIADIFVWGDKHEESIFDFMCESNFLEKLGEICEKSQWNREIRITIIQSICMLVLNIKQLTQITYILSHPLINDLLQFPFDYNDDEFVDYYINFLKTLAIRLDTIPLQLFFNSVQIQSFHAKNCSDFEHKFQILRRNEYRNIPQIIKQSFSVYLFFMAQKRFSNFPLLWQTIRFYNHNDIMIRTSVQNIILSIMKLKSDQLDNYLSSFPFATFYACYCCFIAQQWAQIDVLAQNIDQPLRLDEHLNNQIDLMLFLEDLLNSCNPKAKRILVNSFINYALIPYIFNSFTSTKKGKLMIYTSIYILSLIFKHITNKDILDCIMLTLFGDKMNRKLQEWISHPAQEPANFNPKWQYRHFWDDYEEFVHKQTDQLFVQPAEQPPQQSLVTSEIVLETPSELTKTNSNSGESYSKTKYILSLAKSTLMNVRSYIGWDVQGKCESEIRRLTRSLGIRLIDNSTFQSSFDLSTSTDKSSFFSGDQTADYLGQSPCDVLASSISDLLSETKPDPDQILEENTEQASVIQINSQSYDPNPFKDQIPSYLRSKDDNLIMLTLQLITTIQNSKHISDDILTYCGLMTQHRNKEQFQSPDNIPRIESFQSQFLQILAVDPPFRLINYMLLSNLINEFSTEDPSKEIKFTPTQLKTFNEAFVIQINKMNSMIRTSTNWDFIIDQYEVEYNYVETNSFKNIRQNEYFSFLPLDNCPQNVDHFFMHPTSKRDITRRDLILFFIYRKIRYSMISTTQLQKSELDLNLAFKSFLENKLANWEEGKIYPMDEQLKLLSCEMVLNNKNQQLYFVKNEQNLILIDFIADQLGSVKIIRNVRLKCVEAQINQAEPKRLEISIRKLTAEGKEKYEDIILEFDSSDFCTSTKKILDENRKTSKQIELTVFMKFLENCEKDLFVLPELN